MRTHPETTEYYPAARSTPSLPDAPPRVLIAANDLRLGQYSLGPLTPLVTRSTAGAVQALLSRSAPLAVVDLDDPAIDGIEICRAARNAGASVLVTTSSVERVPAILKAGCDGVLLKPYQPNLLSARLGRLMRALPARAALSATSAARNGGTNAVWSDVACPTCGTNGPTSFDFLSHRRMWYACLACDATWVGRRRE